MECWSLSTIDQSPDAAFTLQDLGTHPCIYPLPGCLIVPTSTGIYVLDPVTLTPIPCKMLQTGDTDSHSEDGDGIPRPQFDVGNCTLTILSVFNINWSSNKDKQNTSGCLSLASANAVNSQSNFSYVAMALNYRLIVMKVMMR